MIDPQHHVIRALAQAGCTVAAHAYLRPGGRVNFTFVARHAETGRVIQGWSRGGSAVDALRKLGKRAGLDT